ncbi:hypothetical protein [Micromonospora sp. NPDC057141]|uniref:hypothetical protein n=1 Tax=Micromonospora sp. NPDC057141 TaxID=3346033 RepID=UPI003642F678
MRDWFLTAAGRANPVSRIPVWTTGNLAEPLIHGSAHFDRPVSEVAALAAGAPVRHLVIGCRHPANR